MPIFGVGCGASPRSSAAANSRRVVGCQRRRWSVEIGISVEICANSSSRSIAERAQVVVRPDAVAGRDGRGPAGPAAVDDEHVVAAADPHRGVRDAGSCAGRPGAGSARADRSSAARARDRRYGRPASRTVTSNVPWSSFATVAPPAPLPTTIAVVIERSLPSAVSVARHAGAPLVRRAVNASSRPSASPARRPASAADISEHTSGEYTLANAQRATTICPRSSPVRSIPIRR